MGGHRPCPPAGLGVEAAPQVVRGSGPTVELGGPGDLATLGCPGTRPRSPRAPGAGAG